MDSLGEETYHSGHYVLDFLEIELQGYTKRMDGHS